MQDATQPESEEPSRLTFFIDGAHTPESMTSCGQWFGEAAEEAANADSAMSHVIQPASTFAGESQLQRVLLFHCMKVREQAVLLLKKLLLTGKHHTTCCTERALKTSHAQAQALLVLQAFIFGGR